MNIHETFSHIVSPHWTQTQQGDGVLVRRQGALHLSLLPADASTYHNAQLTDYAPKIPIFTCKPPLRLTVHALSSLHPANLHGTAGFGFWNHALAPDKRGMGLPQTLWFFFSGAESNMALAQGVNGNGWKAASMNARRPLVRGLLPFAPLATALARVKPLNGIISRTAQQVLGVHEALLDPETLTADNVYTLEWLPNKATFSVNEQVVHVVNNPPRNPLGFIAWMDNQYAIVRYDGTFKMGLTSIQRPQALVLREIKIESL